MVSDAYIYIYIYIYIYGSACSIMIIGMGNRYGEHSSKSGQGCFT